MVRRQSTTGVPPSSAPQPQAGGWSLAAAVAYSVNARSAKDLQQQQQQAGGGLLPTVARHSVTGASPGGTPPVLSRTLLAQLGASASGKTTHRHSSTGSLLRPSESQEGSPTAAAAALSLGTPLVPPAARQGGLATKPSAAPRPWDTPEQEDSHEWDVEML
jgi:hypothetical protein